MEGAPAAIRGATLMDENDSEDRPTAPSRNHLVLRAASNQAPASQLEPPPSNGGWHALIATTGQFFSNLCRRFLIWFVALVVSFYIPLADNGLPYPFMPWAEKIVHEGDGKVRDIFFGTLAMTVLSLSNLADNIISRRDRGIDNYTILAAWILVVVYFFFVLFGMPLYGNDQAVNPPPSPQWGILLSMLGCSLFGEVLISTLRE
jgi:hypothetical protein